MKNDLLATENKNFLEKAKPVIGKVFIACETFTKLATTIREFAPTAKNFTCSIITICKEAKSAWSAINNEHITLTEQSAM